MLIEIMIGLLKNYKPIIHGHFMKEGLKQFPSGFEHAEVICAIERAMKAWLDDICCSVQ